jgi:hypothetical protein
VGGVLEPTGVHLGPGSGKAMAQDQGGVVPDVVAQALELREGRLVAVAAREQLGVAQPCVDVAATGQDGQGRKGRCERLRSGWAFVEVGCR